MILKVQTAGVETWRLGASFSSRNVKKTHTIVLLLIICPLFLLHFDESLSPRWKSSNRPWLYCCCYCPCSTSNLLQIVGSLLSNKSRITLIEVIEIGPEQHPWCNMSEQLLLEFPNFEAGDVELYPKIIANQLSPGLVFNSI